MEAFASKFVEILCHVANVAPTILTKVGEGAVVVGKAVSSVICPGV